jgi:hypothetical protein
MSSMPLGKAVALPPSFDCRHAFDALRGPPSAFHQLRASACARAPIFRCTSRPSRPLRRHSQLPAAARRRATTGTPSSDSTLSFAGLIALKTTARRAGRSGTPPLAEKLGAATTPHLKTLQQHLPKLRS